jgi:hypothetical protein
VLALNVTPKKVIFLFLILFFNILAILVKRRWDRLLLELITVLIIDNGDFDFFAVSIKALVSLGKQDPP